MGGNGGKQKSGSLAEIRTTTPVQSRLGKKEGSASTNSIVPLSVDNALPRSCQARRVRRDDSSVNTETVYSRDVNNRVRFLFSGFSGPQKVGGVEARDRSIKAQRISHTGDLSDGHVSKGKSGGGARDVCHIPRLIRRVSPYPHEGRFASVPMFPSKGQTLHVPRSTVRPNVSTVGLHGGSKTSETVVIKASSHPIPVPRRLAKPVPVAAAGGKVDRSVSRAVPSSGPVGESREIRATSHTGDSISRRKVRFAAGKGVPYERAPTHSHAAPNRGKGTARASISQSRVTSRTVVSDSFHRPVRQASHETIAVGRDRTGTSRKRQGRMGTGHRPVSPSAGMVEGSSTLVGRSAVPGTVPPGDSLHRCVDQRLGCSIPGIDVERDVAETRSSHKLVGTTGGPGRSTVTPVPSQGEDSSLYDRQLDHSLLSEKTGGDEVASAPQVVIENTEVSPCDTTDHSPETHRGSVERLSGPGLKGGTSDSVRVGPLTVHVPVGDQPVPVGTTTGGHVRKQSKSQVKQIHIPVPGLTSVSSGCNKLPVAIGSNVCVSTDVHSGTFSATSQDRGAIQDSPGSAVEPTGEVAAHSQQPTGEASDSISSGARNATPTTLESQSPESRVSEPTSGLPGEGRLKSLGFSDNVISRIGKSRAASTRKHYKSQWDLFVTWATEQKLNPLDASLPLLTSFMDYLFRVRNVSVRTILNYKSAIAFYWKSEVGYDVPENDTVVSDLIRSFKRDRPFPTKHVVEWDVHLVLNFFRSGRFKQWDLLSDRDLTLKTVFLLALATGKRRGELHALAKDVRWLSGAVRAVEISPVPEFLSKTHVKTNGLGALRPLTVSSLDGAVESEDNEERLLCPVRTLEAYLSRSDQYRSPEQKRLFISYRRGTVKDISRQTISVYIKEAVVLAYSDPSQKDTKSPVHVKPHSVRHVATSLSALRNFSLDDVLKAGAWSSPNVFLKHYVQNFSTDALSKLSRLGGFVAAGAVI